MGYVCAPVFYLFFVIATRTPIGLSMRLTLVDAGAVATLRFAATPILRRGGFGFELVNETTGFAYEPAEVSGHPGELARAEDTRKRSPMIIISCAPMPNIC